MLLYGFLFVAAIFLLLVILLFVVPSAIPALWRVLIWREATLRWFTNRQSRDPTNPRWLIWLGSIYQGRMFRSTGLARQEAAQQAVIHYERWLSLKRDITNDYSQLDDLAMAAVEAGSDAKAKRYAMQLLQLPVRHPGVRFGNAIHYGNIVLGRLALRQGDTEQAKEFLLRAGATPGSPQLVSFGPNMILAKELLEQGERDVVLQYFDLCANFWKLDKKRGVLRWWANEVQEGRIPNFGNNLNRS